MSATAAAADSIRYAVRITGVNRVGLTVSNYGFFGNNFNSRTPSFEFPLGSGFEHMSRAGLWVGAVAVSDTGLFTGVSTGIIDDNQGTNALSGTEFTPAGNVVLERSRIPNNPSYSKLAISDEDLVCAYSDEPARGPQGYLSEAHQPLDVVVNQTTLGFSLPAAQDFEVMRFSIVNHGPPLKNLYVGFFVQLTIGNKNLYPTWPPSATAGAGSWYYKVYAEYDTTRRMYRAHYCQSVPYPGFCNFNAVPPWSAVKLLGVHPDSVAAKVVSFNWWNHTLGDTSLAVDRQRYARMSDGLHMDPRDCQPGAAQCSPIAMLSVGPFAQVDPGDTVTVDYALIGGDDETALFKNADFAQFASDINYRLPSPPPSPRLRVAAGANRVDYYWDDSPEHTPDETSPAPNHLDFEGYRLYLGLDRQHPQRIAQFDNAAPPGDTVGFNTGFAAVRHDTIIDGVPYQYHYAVHGLRDG
ncbi:MAG: hypothetical protein HY076_04380, partial [Candidatus Eisenbacteria bacterium]|nr:hypothetical protein [Candidatus Eisenbacteria bacterium]